LLNEVVKKKDYSSFQLIICSINRSKVDGILNRMQSNLLLEGLNILDQEWLQEILFSLKENTYNKVMFQVK
jgi:hypothetical protein